MVMMIRSVYLMHPLIQVTMLIKFLRMRTEFWLEKQFFTSADVSMLDYGYGVSQYPQFMTDIQISTKYYHVHLGGLLRFFLDKNV